MTVYRPKGRTSFEYDFWFQRKRYRDNTYQTKLADAEAVEAKLKERLRHRAGGIDVPQREDSPTFSDWAEAFYAYKKKHLERPDALANILPVVLRFWGASVPRPGEPATTPTTEKPFHDLRLCDPIDEPDWILKFEAWLTLRGFSNQYKNHLRGVMRRMYAVALLPEYRKRTGVQVNPFVGVPNDQTRSRDVTITAAELRRVLAHASYHIRLACAIGALAWKLRERNILELTWTQIEPDPRPVKFSPRMPYYITVRRHKTERRTRQPLVAPVSQQLLRILKDAWRRDPESDHVVTYRGRPVKDILAGVRAAVEAAGLPYGWNARNREGESIGVTFHTLRHSMTTLLSDALEDPLQLMDAAGHGDIATTLRYRHKRPRHQKPVVEQLSRMVKIEDVVTSTRRRAPGKKRSA